MKNKREITIRVTEQEFAMLESHCQAVGRTKTDILREFIRSLGSKITDTCKDDAGI